ncbi:hypothetical protein COLO4_29952 [Corchorus olitorius]|uniref:CCHC-type domain-containing protein n=1 Tax=Corchorus olitorius TaxID=93759 RepID=A0A1R3HCB5_9ROSI|nr:hypothetical protein COLO4_29952 [Corchorus olitorius]
MERGNQIRFGAGAASASLLSLNSCFDSILANPDFFSQLPIKGKEGEGDGDDGYIHGRLSYERLSLFCYNCGVLGHEEYDCDKEKVIIDGEEVKQYGPWLVASPLKRKAAVVGTEAFKQLGKKVFGGFNFGKQAGVQSSKAKRALFPWTTSRLDSGRPAAEKDLQLVRRPREEISDVERNSRKQNHEIIGDNIGNLVDMETLRLVSNLKVTDGDIGGKINANNPEKGGRKSVAINIVESALQKDSSPEGKLSSNCKGLLEKNQEVTSVFVGRNDKDNLGLMVSQHGPMDADQLEQGAFKFQAGQSTNGDCAEGKQVVHQRKKGWKKVKRTNSQGAAKGVSLGKRICQSEMEKEEIEDSTEKRTVGKIDVGAKVAELIDSDRSSWNLDLIDSLFDPEEAMAIRHVAIGRDRNDPMEHKKTLKEIWNLDVPPKIKVFGWRVFHYIHPVLSNLQRRGLEVNPKCPRCEKEDETVDHALIECEKAEQVRLMVHEAYENSKQEVVATDQMRFGNLNWADIALVMSWAICGARNKKVHEDLEYSASETTAFVISYIMEFQRCKKRLLHKQISIAAQWLAPEQNVIKVNFDGAFDSVANIGGYGVIARDYKGLVLGAYAGRVDFVLDAFAAEGVAALKAITCARHMGFSRIILEGDALTVIRKVNSEDTDLSPIAAYIADLKEDRT